MVNLGVLITVSRSVFTIPFAVITTISFACIIACSSTGVFTTLAAASVTPATTGSLTTASAFVFTCYTTRPVATTSARSFTIVIAPNGIFYHFGSQ